MSISAGLASDIVSDIMQDGKGFIWISTGNGLQKYDGGSFINYHHDPYDTQSISSDNTNALLNDRENNIWVSTSFSGFNLFNPSTGKFTRVSEFKDPDTRDLNSSSMACLDTMGNVWLMAINALAKYDVATHRLIPYNHLLSKDKVMGMTKTILCDPRTNNLWFNSYLYGICMLDSKREVLYFRKNNPQKLPVFDLVDDPGTLFLDRQNNLWINTYSGRLYRYNLVTGQSRRFYLPDFGAHSGDERKILVDCMMQDGRGRIWMGARKDGLLECSPGADTLLLLSREDLNREGLIYNEYIACLREDREGNIWIGSDKGVSVFNPYRQQFHSVNLAPVKYAPINTNSVSSFVQTGRGDIWVGSYGQGILVYDQQMKYQKTYAYNANHQGIVGEPGNRVWCFLSRPDGKTFVGCQHGWLGIYDSVKGKFSNLQPPGLNKLTIINMVPDRAGNIWFALYSGFGKWDHEKNSFTRYPYVLSSHGKTEDQVYDVMVDKDQKIWVATQTNGLQLFDSAAGRFTVQFIHEKDDPASISDNSVQCIQKINDTLFALGTANGGVDFFNPRTRRFTYLTTRDGLPSNNVTSLFFHPPHDLWVACAQSLCRVNLDNDRVFHYGIEDGIFSSDFFDCLRFYQSKSGNLFLGYVGGFVYFHPDSIQRIEPPADVAITGFKIYAQPLLVDSLLTKSDTVDLPYMQNFISMEFASLSFLESQKITYYYRLQGVDKDWVNPGKQRSAAYANLSPGTYAFMVKCENRDGILSKKTTTLYVVIHPPFWQTWWFKSLVVAVIILFIYGLFRYRINQLLALHAMRNEISKDLHDDLGATLGSISILSEIARSRMETGDQGQIQFLLTRISRNSREMVEKMSDIVWAINPKNENIEKIIQRLSNFSLETCESRDIQLDIKADDLSRTRVLHMGEIKNIYLIVKEAMSNAIRHADCHHLTVTFKSFAAALEISIMDDGIGFDPKSVKNGNGLSNMESRAREMKGYISFHSENRATVISLHLPVT